MKNARYYFPGSIMLALAFLIIAVPELLFALVAGSMVMIGLGLLYAGHLMKKSSIRFHGIDSRRTDAFYDPYQRRSPFVRIWYGNL